MQIRGNIRDDKLIPLTCFSFGPFIIQESKPNKVYKKSSTKETTNPKINRKNIGLSKL